MVAEVADLRARVRQSRADSGEPALERTARAELVGLLFRRHRRSLVGYLTKLVPSRADAEEVAQEAFARLLAAASLEPDAVRARSYLFATATNLARDHHRRRTAREGYAHVQLDDVPLESEGAPPDMLADSEQLWKIIAGALGDLLPRPRKAFLLHVCEEVTYEQIAAELGVSKKTVERDIALTFALCRSRLARWNGA